MDATPDATMRQAANWSIAIGVLILIAGLIAVMVPMVAALAATFAFAWIALFIGVLQLIHAYQMRTEKGLTWRVLTGLLNVALGIVFFWKPLEGVVALALLLAGLITAIGIIEILFALQRRPAPGWGWVLALGIVSVLLGILIAIGWPQNSFLLIGLYVGINMISGGIWRIARGIAVRKAAGPPPTNTPSAHGTGAAQPG
jgi:uncharacterized membrane protein HdeD (DUF308 family)